MTLWQHLYRKMNQIPLNQMGILLLVALGVVVKSVCLASLDISAFSFYLDTVGLAYLPQSFIFGAIVMSVCGYYSIIFDRRYGYGAVPVCGILLAVCGGILWMLPEYPILSANILFLYNMAAFILMNAAFWTVTQRFIPLTLESRKFGVVLGTELSGYALTGWVVFLWDKPWQSLLMMSFIMAVLFVCILKVLVFLNPVPTQTFFQKMGGSQDIAGKRLEKYLFSYAWVSVVAKGILLMGWCWILYERNNFVHDVSLLWGVVGALGLITMGILYRIRYLHMMLSGVLSFAFSFIIGGFGMMFHSYAGIFIGLVISMLCAYFYVPQFLSMLPRLFAVGQQKRIKFQRLVFLEPLSFICVGVLLYSGYSYITCGALLLGAGIILIGTTYVLVYLYSESLTEMISRRQWRGGPLMIVSKKLLKYMVSQLPSDNPDDVIYFMRVLSVAKHPLYHKYLGKLLKHPHEAVRLFALHHIERLYPIGTYKNVLKKMIESEDSKEVKKQALALCIQDEYSRISNRVIKKYMSYLSDKILREGVLIGLLKTEGEGRVFAIDYVINLLESKKKADILSGLTVVEQSPIVPFIPYVSSCLKSSDFQIMQQALLTAGATRHPELLNDIFNALDDFELQETALNALKVYGKRAFPTIEKILHHPNMPSVRQKILVLFLNQLPSGEGKQILLRALSCPNQKLRKTVMYALIDSGIVWVHKNKKAILIQGIKKDVERIRFNLSFIEKYTQIPSHGVEETLQFLRRAFWEDCEDTRELILLQIQLLWPHPLVAKAVRVLSGTQQQDYVTALGVIQDFVPYRLYKQIKSIMLLPIKNHNVSEERVISDDMIVERLSLLLLKPPFDLPPWVKATALYCLRRFGSEHAKPAVINALHDSNPIVVEAAIWALVRLEQDKQTLHKTLLQVPTSLLAGQSLEQILDS